MRLSTYAGQGRTDSSSWRTPGRTTRLTRESARAVRPATRLASYAQAPADATGTAAGILRTFMYLGAIASASLISLSFGRAATDSGLHRLAVMLTVAATGLLAVTLADRKLAAARPRPR